VLLYVNVLFTFKYVQRKSITKSVFALSFGRVLMTDMTEFASTIRGYNAAAGFLTPANRYLEDDSAPECCRSTVGKIVHELTPGASIAALNANLGAKKAQAARRARIK
jgi:hypothetical protein